MVNILNVNSFVDSMLYYLGRTNDYGIQKRFTAVAEQYPEQHEALEKAVQPAFALEKLLDAKLNINEKLLVKYFKNFNSSQISNSPFGFCLASVMMFHPLMQCLGSSADEFVQYLTAFSEKEQIYSLCFGLIDECEKLDENDVSREAFSKRVEKLSISFENKWKLLNAEINYEEHIRELLSLLMPAVKLIDGAKNKYKTAIESFYKYYSENNARSLLEHKFKYFDIMNVVPVIFGFDQTFAVVASRNEAAPSDENTVLTTNTIMGIAQHIISGSNRYKVSNLSKQLKTLSDNTRLEILFYLCSHRAYGQEICAKFGIQHPTVSHHMSKLIVAGLVKDEVSGNRTYYTADKAGIQRMIDAFAEKIK